MNGLSEWEGRKLHAPVSGMDRTVFPEWSHVSNLATAHACTWSTQGDRDPLWPFTALI